MRNTLAAVVLLVMFRHDESLSVITSKTSTSQMIKDSGYPIEEIIVTTLDGYKLTMHRIPGGKGDTEKIAPLPPVLLVHGLGGSSGDFVILGPKRSLGYLLADAGYDVFLGNMRFNMHASHVNMTKNNSKYWDFSLDEHGQYDIPAHMDEILKVTGAPGLHYIGYSMGSLVYMMACTVRPDLADKIISYIGLAPAVHMDNLQPLAKIAFQLQVANMLREQGISHVSLGARYQRAIASGLCSPRIQSKDLCMSLIFLLIGEDYDQIDKEMIPIVVSRFQPISINQLEHYAQLALTDKMTHYDRGTKKNLEIYGSKRPPLYDTNANKAPVALFYGSNDKLTPPHDIKQLASQYRMTNIPVMTRRVPWKKFNHYDFIVAKDLPTLKVMKLYETLRDTNKEVKLYKAGGPGFTHLDFAIAKELDSLLNKRIVNIIKYYTEASMKLEKMKRQNIHT